MKVPFVDLAAQHSAIGDELREVLLAVMTRGDFILGRDVGLFEEEFAAYCGTRYAVGVDSGTSALELTLLACGIGAGDEVLIPANTFIATALAVSYTGARPVPVDIEPLTCNIAPAQLEAALTARTKAILPVHLYGQPADMDAVTAFARQYNLIVIEDACQAHGARYKGRRAGSLGLAAAFSFYPSKNLGAFGDAGMMVTDDERVAAQVRMLRDYGQRAKYQHAVRGFNRRLDTMQAAVLRVKLRYLDGWNAARRQHAQQYAALLSHSPLVLPWAGPDVEHVYHLYAVRVREGGAERRDALRAFLQNRGIATGIHYPVPIHLQEAYRDLGYAQDSFPVTEDDAQRSLSLPMYPELAADQIAWVAAAIADWA